MSLTPIGFFAETSAYNIAAIPSLPTGSILGYWDAWNTSSFASLPNGTRLGPSSGSLWFDLSGNNYTASFQGVGDGNTTYKTIYEDGRGLHRGPCISFKGMTLPGWYEIISGSTFNSNFATGSNPSFTVLVYHLTEGGGFGAIGRTMIRANNKFTISIPTPGPLYNTFQYGTKWYDPTSDPQKYGSVGIATVAGVWTTTAFVNAPSGSGTSLSGWASGSYYNYNIQYNGNPPYSGSTNPQTGSLYGGDQYFRIGSDGPGSETPPYRVGYDGMIQAVVVYNRALSIDEVNQACQYFTRRLPTYIQT
jgi:hypothetical protein